MLLRLLLKLLKPTDQELRRKSNGRLVRCKVGIYQFCLKQLAGSYSHYAMSDTVVIYNDALRITREFRDVGFENELNRNKISFTSPLTSQTFPMTRQKNKARRFFYYFRFEDLLRITIDGKELVIRHNDCYTIDGSVNAGLKCTDKRGGFSRAVVSVRRGHSENSEHSRPDPPIRHRQENRPVPDDNKKSHRRIFDKEKEIPPIISPGGTVPASDTGKGSQPLKKNGFEIDTDF